jgi:hypothetical protein
MRSYCEIGFIIFASCFHLRALLTLVSIEELIVLFIFLIFWPKDNSLQKYFTVMVSACIVHLLLKSLLNSFHLFYMICALYTQYKA